MRTGHPPWPTAIALAWINAACHGPGSCSPCRDDQHLSPATSPVKSWNRRDLMTFSPLAAPDVAPTATFSSPQPPRCRKRILRAPRSPQTVGAWLLVRCPSFRLRRIRSPPAGTANGTRVRPWRTGRTRIAKEQSCHPDCTRHVVEISIGLIYYFFHTVRIRAANGRSIGGIVNRDRAFVPKTRGIDVPAPLPERQAGQACSAGGRVGMLRSKSPAHGCDQRFAFRPAVTLPPDCYHAATPLPRTPDSTGRMPSTTLPL